MREVLKCWEWGSEWRAEPTPMHEMYLTLWMYFRKPTLSYLRRRLKKLPRFLFTGSLWWWLQENDSQQENHGCAMSTSEVLNKHFLFEFTETCQLMLLLLLESHKNGLKLTREIMGVELTCGPRYGRELVLYVIWDKWMCTSVLHEVAHLVALRISSALNIVRIINETAHAGQNSVRAFAVGKTSSAASSILK